MRKKILVVGGVAGGASTVTRLRRLNEEAEIILFERDEYISFANCGLPYYIGGVIKDRDELLVQTPEAMKKRFNIDVRVFSEVVSIDSDKKKIRVNSRVKGEYDETYDYLVLSPGVKALRPNIPGINNDKILTLRNISDTDKIKSQVMKKELKNIVVIGGGFVGVEMAENLKELGFDTTLVEAAPHILAPFDSDIVSIAENKLISKGVKLILNNPVSAFEEKEKGLEITLGNGDKLNTDLVILSIGVVPDTAFIKESGIELGVRGHIIVNECLQTNIEDIYAVGDAIEVVDYITDKKTAIPLAGPANKQGRTVADNIVAQINKEEMTKYKGSQGTSVIKIFEITAASTGANERVLKAAGIEYKSVTIHPLSSASYYPGARTMTLKLIFDLNGKILGAQGMGIEGVEKRIDVIATAIRFNGTIRDLTEIDLSYAPPYSSAKDPVNMIGYVAENVLSGKVNIINWEEINDLNKEDYILLDVSTALEHKNDKINGAINIPVDELRYRLDELDKDKMIIIYCRVGLRGYIACRMLNQYGFNTRNINGGSLIRYYIKKNR